MMVFKPLHYKFPPFSEMDPGLIPIFSSEVTFNIYYQNNPKTKITQRQYPLSAAYTFTDHKAQGQTIKNMIVDIGTTK
jgi:ATP-dependent exoDNAse (exonuclease V) alpha subunit